MKSLTAFVVACILIVIMYVIIAIAVQVITGMQLPDSLNVGMFGLFGSELAVSGFIKIFKIRKGE